MMRGPLPSSATMLRRGLLVAGWGLMCMGRLAAETQDAVLPPDTAPAPPPPVQLAPPRQSVPVEQLALPAEMQRLAQGGFRLRIPAGELTAAHISAVTALGRSLAGIANGRITIEAQVAGPADDPSTARRASLAFAQTVKAALVAGGVAPTRIDVRPLGRLPSAIDAVDILPPGVASPNAEARRS